jgi:hypothetical protein
MKSKKRMPVMVLLEVQLGAWRFTHMETSELRSNMEAGSMTRILHIDGSSAGEVEYRSGIALNTVCDDADMLFTAVSHRAEIALKSRLVY